MTIQFGWWMIPAAITIVTFLWAVLFHRIAGSLSTGFIAVWVFVDLFYYAALVLSLGAWLLYAVITFLVEPSNRLAVLRRRLAARTRLTTRASPRRCLALPRTSPPSAPTSRAERGNPNDHDRDRWPLHGR